MQTAYSYLRFSSPKQIQKDKLWRQMKQAKDYAKANDLIFDEDLTFRDLGVSAYRGANRKVGRLADFLFAVRHGQVAKGSYLLVESLDRLSRDTARKALRTLEDICDEGITVVTLIDNQKYTSESLDKDPASLIFSMVIFLRANEESRTKSKRQLAVWNNKIDRARNGENLLICGSKPSWILHTDGEFSIDHERAKSIRLIFQLAELGQGCSVIAKTLNMNKMPRMGCAKFWSHPMVRTMMKNPTVTGTYTPHFREEIDGEIRRVKREPIRGYYPRVISQKSWNRVQAHIERRQKKFNSAGGFPIVSVRSLFGYLAKCPRCGAPMNRRTYAQRTLVDSAPGHQLICSRALASDDCHFKAVPYEPLEILFYEEGSEMMRDHLAYRHSQAKSRSQKHKNSLLATRVETIEELMATDPENRKTLNSHIRSVFDRVTIDYDNENLEFNWAGGSKTSLPYGEHMAEYMKERFGKQPAGIQK